MAAHLISVNKKPRPYDFDLYSSDDASYVNTPLISPIPPPRAEDYEGVLNNRKGGKKLLC